MFYVALALNCAFVGAMTFASIRHFKRGEHEPKGATLLSIATLLGTLANIWLALNGPRGPASLLATSIVLSLAAFSVFLAAVRETRTRGLSLAFSDRTPKRVVSSGIYGVIRHPFYTSYLLYWSSWIALTGGHPFTAAFAVGMLLFYVTALRKEERLLSQNLGEPYLELMRKTHRLLPWIY